MFAQGFLEFPATFLDLKVTSLKVKNENELLTLQSRVTRIFCKDSGKPLHTGQGAEIHFHISGTSPCRIEREMGILSMRRFCRRICRR